MDLARLRVLLRPHVGALKDSGTNDVLPAICAQLGLPPPPDASSKRERLHASFDAAVDNALPEVARRFIVRFPPSASLRNEIQDILWADDPGPPIPKRFRRELARTLEAGDLYGDANKFDAVISSLFEIEDNPLSEFFGAQNDTLRGQIDRHV